MAKRKDDAVVKTKGSAGKKGAKAETKAASEPKAAGRKQAKAEEVAAVVAPAPTPGPAKTKKAGGRKKAAKADVAPEPAPAPVAAKKPAGRKKAAKADVAPEPAPAPVAAKKPAGRKKAAKADVAVEATPAPVAAKKPGGRKKADVAPAPAPEPVAAKKTSKKAAKADVAAEPAPEPAAAKKAGGRKKKATADVAPEPTPEPAVAKKAGGRKKKADVAPEPTPEPAAAKKAGGRKKKADVAPEPTPEPVVAKKTAKAEKAKAAKAEPTPTEPKADKKTSQKAGKKTSKKPAKAKKPAEPTLADRLDKHDLYQRSVQSPEADLEFFVARYKDLRGREPKVLREDFCGTAYISSTWAGSAKGRRAIGVDLDAATLQWAREHNVAPLAKDAQKRVELRQANVLDGGGTRSDITCAMNFSYGVFKTRAELKHYLEVAYQQLADDGMFVTELYGGTEAIVAVQDEREIEGDESTGGDFTYLWEQAAYNPITHETLCHIHFRLSDGSTIEKAFTYDWRLWSIAELRELLYEVGFQSVRVYWEAIDEDGDGSGEYYATEQEENQESWLVYLVAGK